MIRTASVHATRSARAAAVRGAQSGAGVPARALADSAQGGDPAPEHESFVRGMFRGEMKEASVFPYPDVRRAGAQPPARSGARRRVGPTSWPPRRLR